MIKRMIVTDKIGEELEIE